MLFQKIQRCSKEKVWGKHLMGKSYVTTVRHFFLFCLSKCNGNAKECLFCVGFCAQFDPLLPLAFMSPGSHGLTTYKELCSLASDLNQPDLVYKFMNLANHHAMWNSRKVSCSCIIHLLFPVHHFCHLPTIWRCLTLPST